MPAIPAHASFSSCGNVEDGLPDLYEASIVELQAGLEAGRFTSVHLVKAYFARIDEVNLKGPGLRAVLELNPSALRRAAELDAERAEKGKRGVMHGIPVLLKDNIATVASEGMNTTAGSYSLLGSVPPDDEGVVKRLRAAGAIILGKANLSEFSHFRGALPSGWSPRGGQATNAYYPNGDPCGSSSGSAIAASIGLAPVALGTETRGSIICPASMNNVVGMKPTTGLTSRAGVIPVSSSRDTVGPMTRSVADAAIILSIIAGPDVNDIATLSQPSIVPDYTQALRADALKGKRIGVPRRAYMDNTHPAVVEAFETALDVLRTLGAEVIDPADFPSAEKMKASKKDKIVMNVDFKIDLNAYLAQLKESPTGVRSLADVIRYIEDNSDERPVGYEGLGKLIAAEATSGRDTPEYREALEFDHDIARTRGIDAALKIFKLDALMLPSTGHTSQPAALAGYPIVSVPLGFYPDSIANTRRGGLPTIPIERAPGMPFGIAFFGTAYSEFALTGFAYAFEQATRARLGRRAYAEAIPRTQLRDVLSMN